MLYSRSALSLEMARQLINPGVLDEGLRSGLFISGLRRTGKTTFLRADLIPALEEQGAVVIYVDLWTDTLTLPSSLLQQAVVAKLQELESAGSKAMEKLKRVKGLNIDALGFKLGINLGEVGKPEGTTLAQALLKVVDETKSDVVLIVDEVQQALASEDGRNMLFALKAARDAINPRPETPGHFIFVGAGSHRAQVGELAAKKNQAFAGATSIEFPVLGSDYVDFLIERYAQEVNASQLPTPNVAYGAFRSLGHRPEELKKALGQAIRQGGDPNVVVPIIAQTLRITLADSEIFKVENLGSLALAIFDRIATSADSKAKLFSAEAAADYSAAVGREVKVDEIQPIINALLAENLIMRRGHGQYELADPYVGEIYQDAQRLVGSAGT